MPSMFSSSTTQLSKMFSMVSDLQAFEMDRSREMFQYSAALTK